MRTPSLSWTIPICAVTLIACGGGGGEGSDTSAAIAGGDTAAAAGGPGAGAAGGAGGTSATAPMRDLAGRDLGTLTLSESGQGIAVSGTLRGMPAGEAAIHVHTTGRCDPPFESAGGHWNPTSRQHGTQNPQGPHLGDMPNITVGADGSVQVQVSTTGGTLRGQNALMDADGAAVVIHGGADDYRTDPSGNAGGRIACGVVSGG